MLTLRVIGLTLVVAMIAISTVGQAQVASGQPSFFFPPATGLYQFPFRQARERTPNGAPRSEIGCEGPSGTLEWHPFDERVLSVMPGPHHRKVAWSQVISDSLSNASEARVKRVVGRMACTDADLRGLVGCSGHGTFGVRNRSVDGVVSRNLQWECP
jgi:hypothetical protein